MYSPYHIFGNRNKPEGSRQNLAVIVGGAKELDKSWTAKVLFIPLAQIFWICSNTREHLLGQGKALFGH